MFVMRGKKKITAVVLLAFLLTMVVPLSAFGASFFDVPANHWAIQQIDRLHARTIIGGYEDGTARPNNPVTQFEAVALVTRLMELEFDESQKGTYLPFKYPDWAGAYNTAVVAYEAGLIDVSDFTHNGAASRQWIAKLLIKAMDVEQELSSASSSLSFGDTGSIGSKYLPYVSLAYDKGLIGGYTDGTFKPLNTVTRAEMAAFLCRVEDKLNTNASNVVRGRIADVDGLKVVIDGVDGKTYSLYATTGSALYDLDGNKVGVTGLKVGDAVYGVYKNLLLNYLEVRTSVSGTTTVKTNLAGTIQSVIANKKAIVISDEDNRLQTVLINEQTKITKDSSTVALAFEDLMTGMHVRMAVDTASQIAGTVLIEDTTDGQKSGTIYSVDVYDNLIVMKEKTGLQSYRMSKNISVSVSGKLTATTGDLAEGQQATYTISDGVMTAIAVGSSTDAYGGNATVKSVDSKNLIINYQTASNELKAAYYTNGFAIKFKDGTTGTISDVQVGDTIQITVADSKVTALTVTGRGYSDGIEGTLYAVNSSDRYIIVTNASGSRTTYDLATNVKVTLYGNTAALGSLTKGMTVELTMQDGKVSRIRANDLVEGTVTAVNTSAKTLQVSVNGTNRIYDVASNVTINFYKTTSTRLSAVSVGDVVSLKLVGDEVTVVQVHEKLNMTIYSVYSGGSWIRLQDENGSTVSADLDDVDIFIDSMPGNADDLTSGDAVTATFAGATLTRLEAMSQVKGEVTAVNTTANTITVKTFGSSSTKSVSLGSSYTVVKNGGYTTLSNVRVGDRIVMDASGGRRTVQVLSSRQAKVRFVTGTDIQFIDDTLGSYYKVVSGCYCHRYGSTSQFALDNNNLTNGNLITIYYTDRSHVYEVVKH